MQNQWALPFASLWLHVASPGWHKPLQTPRPTRVSRPGAPLKMLSGCWPTPLAAEGTPAGAPVPVPPAVAAGERLLPGNMGSNSTVGFFSGLCLSFPARWELAVLENRCFPAPMSGACLCDAGLGCALPACCGRAACETAPAKLFPPCAFLI